MLETILELDTQLLLFFNSFHNEYLDWFMSMVTRREIWLPLYLTVGFSVFKGKGRVAILTFLFLLMVPILADLLNQQFFKPYFNRLRPFHVEELKAHLHIFNENPRGRKSFMSGHAMNSFGFATFCLFLFKRKSFTIFILLWAILVTYSRIYLGFHYPGDLIAGALVGIMIGGGLYWAYKQIIYKYTTFYRLRNVTYSTSPIIITGLIVMFCLIASAYHNFIFIEEFTRRFSKLKI